MKTKLMLAALLALVCGGVLVACNKEESAPAPTPPPAPATPSTNAMPTNPPAN